MKKILQSKAFIASAMICLCVGILATCYFVSQEKDNEFTPAPIEGNSGVSEWEETPSDKGNSTDQDDSTDDSEEYPKVVEEDDENVITDFTPPQTDKPEPPAPPEIPEEQTEIDDEGSTPPTYPEVEPEKPADKPADNSPQDGDIREDGAIYLEGFGWIPYEGENTTIPAPNAGTGETIGDM